MEDHFLKARNSPTDSQLVHKASAWLEISEFQIFVEAWQEWYNEKPSERRLEPYFISFLEDGSVPFWLRNYVRLILDRKDLLARERKRILIGALTYYLPLVIFFIIIMWAFYH